MDRAERRKETFRVIENRKRKIKSWHGVDVDNEETNCRPGDLKNNNKMNAYACRTGIPEEKTNWKSGIQDIEQNRVDMAKQCVGVNMMQHN